MDGFSPTQPITTVTPDEVGALSRIVDLLEELVIQGRQPTGAVYCSKCGTYHIPD